MLCKHFFFISSNTLLNLPLFSALLTMNGERGAIYPWHALVPKTETEAMAFIHANPDFDGRNIVVVSTLLCAFIAFSTHLDVNLPLTYRVFWTRE